MAWTYTIDTITPAGTDAPSILDNRIREAKGGWQERLNIDHLFGLTGTQVSDDDTGEHRKITFHEAITKPTAVEGKCFLYIKDVNDKPELHFEDEDGNEIQLSVGGALLAALNNAYLVAIDANGTGTVDLIKADAADVVVVPDGTQNATDAAPTEDKALANKKYVDDYVDDAVSVENTSAFTDVSNSTGDWATLIEDTITTTSGNLLVFFSSTIYLSGGDEVGSVRLSVDDVVKLTVRLNLTDAADTVPVYFHWYETGLASEEHTVTIEWIDDSGTIYQQGTKDDGTRGRVLTLIELSH